jgi:hypothetical protein
VTDLIGVELPTACPFCGGALAVSLEPPSVMHALPMCREFQRDEPVVFLRKARKAFEAARRAAGKA